MQRECGFEGSLECVVRGEETTAASSGRLGGDAAGRLGLTLEGLEDLDGAIGASGAAVRLDQVGRPLHEPRLAELPFLHDSLHRLERHDRGFGIAAPELQQPERRAGEHAREQEAGRRVCSEARLRPAAALLVLAERGLHASDRRLSKPELGALGRLFEQRDRLVGSCESRHPAADPEVELGQLDQRLRQVQQRAARPLHAHGPREQSAGDGVLLHPDERPADGSAHLVSVLHVLPGFERELDEQGGAGGVAGHRLGERVRVPFGRRPRPGGIAQPPRALRQLEGGGAFEPEDRQVRREAEQGRGDRGIELADLLCLFQQHRVSRLHVPARHPQTAEQNDELRVEPRVVDQVRRLVSQGLAPHQISGRVHGVCRAQQPRAARRARLRQRGGTLEGGRARAKSASGESPSAGAVDLVGDHVVEPQRGGSPVPRAAIGIGVRVRERSVHEPQLGRVGAVVGSRPDQGMPELEPVGFDAQQSQ